MLLEQIENKYKEALKAKDSKVVNTMRMLKSNIQNKSIELHKELEDNQISDIIKSMVKKNDESIEMFIKGNRQDLVDDYSKENDILKTFLPQTLSEENTKKLIEGIRAACNILDFKPTIGDYMKQLKQYNNVDTKIASKILKEIL